MNFPATLSITAAAVGLLFALLTLAVSSGPGWRELRPYALAAFTAGCFAITEAFSTLDVSPTVSAWASRIGLALTGVHAAAWYLYTAAKQGRQLHRFERAIIVVGLVFGGLALVPGLALCDTVSSRDVSWLGVVYRDVLPTRFAIAIYAFDVAALGWLIAGYLRAAIRREPYAILHFVGLGLLCLAGLHDSVVATVQAPMPYLVGLGCLAASTAVGAALTRRFVAQSRALAAAQEALVRRERLAALGELAAVIAHEVRNPVGVIYNATATLHRHTKSPDGVALVAIIEEEATRLGRIVDELLVFTRPTVVERDFVDAARLVRSAVQAAIDTAPDEPPEVTLDIEQGLTVDGDEHLLRQALINLVANALQAADAARVIVSARAAGPHTVLSVEDDGSGVPEAHRERIFSPFFTTRATGTGLGLAIVRRIAEAHGGEATLDDNPAGASTRFTIRLPRARMARP